jgi:hypothetical protein
MARADVRRGAIAVQGVLRATGPKATGPKATGPKAIVRKAIGRRVRKGVPKADRAARVDEAARAIGADDRRVTAAADRAAVHRKIVRTVPTKPKPSPSRSFPLPTK